MTKNEAVQVNQIYSIFKRPLFSGHLCPNILNEICIFAYSFELQTIVLLFTFKTWEK